MNWIVLGKPGTRRTRARFVEPRLTATLVHLPSNGVAVLNGEHGLNVLTATAEQWNATGYTPQGTHEKTAADYPTEKGRARFFTRKIKTIQKP